MMKMTQWTMAMFVFGLVSLAQMESRQRRALLNLFSDNHQPVYHTGDASPVIIGDGDGSKLTTGQNWMGTLHQQTNRLIEGAGDVVMTPVNVLTHIKEYWPIYVVLFAVILVALVFLYCSCQRTIMDATNPKHFLLTNFLQALRQPDTSQISESI